MNMNLPVAGNKFVYFSKYFSSRTSKNSSYFSPRKKGKKGKFFFTLIRRIRLIFVWHTRTEATFTLFIYFSRHILLELVHSFKVTQQNPKTRTLYKNPSMSPYVESIVYNMRGCNMRRCGIFLKIDLWIFENINLLKVALQFFDSHFVECHLICQRKIGQRSCSTEITN